MGYQFKLYVALLGMVLASLTLAPAGAQQPDAPFLSVVRGYFQAKSNYLPGDLISQSDWKDLLKLLEAADVETRAYSHLSQQMLPESAFLVGFGRSKQGLGFLRRLGKIPGGYAAAHDLASRQGGQQNLKRLSRDPGGERIIAYIATAPGGKALVSGVPRLKTAAQQSAVSIFTAEQLMAALANPAGRR